MISNITREQIILMVRLKWSSSPKRRLAPRISKHFIFTAKSLEIKELNDCLSKQFQASLQDAVTKILLRMRARGKHKSSHKECSVLRKETSLYTIQMCVINKGWQIRDPEEKNLQNSLLKFKIPAENKIEKLRE